eukprot:1356775-Rhodomonas_salina.1
MHARRMPRQSIALQDPGQRCRHNGRYDGRGIVRTAVKHRTPPQQNRPPEATESILILRFQIEVMRPPRTSASAC